MNTTDQLEIAEVLYRYGWGMDTRDWDLVLGAFTPDARGEYSDLGTFEGRGAILGGLREVIDTIDSVHHIITNHHAQVDGDRARVWAYVTTLRLHRGAPGGDAFTFLGTYENDVVRTPEGWKIEALRYQRIWETGDAGAGAS